MDLPGVLKELAPRLKGNWIVSDGALLGLIREGGLLSYDDDIDLILDEDCKIDLNGSGLKIQEYYICDKIYNPNNEIVKVNKWTEYCGYIKMNNMNLGRKDILSLASKSYKEEGKDIEFTKNHIDIFRVKKDSSTGKYLFKGSWAKFQPHQYYTEDEMKGCTDHTLGFPVRIPKNAEEVLERIYGKDWRTPNKDFKYY